EGRRQFRNRRRRPQAVRLLRRVREIDPQALNPTLDLARLLRKTGSRAEAMRILREIESSCTGRPLRRVRGAQLRGSPTPGQFWLWLRALILRR
ncbi:MAG: tetratricopeptide repeat protein, partial [Myxococcota bacterium]